jgi:DUF1680 family protein
MAYVITLHLPMTIRRVYANPLVRHAAGGIQRGPLVYCLEEADNGAELHNLTLPEASRVSRDSGHGRAERKSSAVRTPGWRRWRRKCQTVFTFVTPWRVPQTLPV